MSVTYQNNKSSITNYFGLAIVSINSTAVLVLNDMLNLSLSTHLSNKLIIIFSYFLGKLCILSSKVKEYGNIALSRLSYIASLVNRYVDGS
jgi:hypothetical protein